MATRDIKIGLALLTLAAWAGPARAQNTGAWATGNGNWETPSIWTTGSVPGSTNNVYIGSASGTTVPANAALNATVTLTANESAADVYLGYGNTSSGTLNLGSNTLSVTGTINIGIVGNGGTGSITESGGSFTAGGLYLYSAGSSINSYTFGAKDVVGSLLVNASTATTSATGNVTGGAYVEAGGTLNLGAAMNFYGTGIVDVEGAGSVINMHGHSIGANAVELGYNGSSAATIENQGTISTGNLFLGNGTTLTMGTSDQASDLTLATKATLTTVAVGNLGGNVGVYSGSTLNLGATLSVLGNVDVEDTNSAINANGHGISSQNLYVGWFDGVAASLNNVGKVTTEGLFVGYGSSLTLHGGDVVNSSISLTRGSGSTLTVEQVGGTGLMLNGTSLSDLSIGTGNRMNLIFTSSLTSNWDFAWKDPSANANWISTLDGMITSGEIKITSADGYHVFDNGGYTYIAGGAVPEPSSVIMLSLGVLGVAGVMAARRRRAG